MAEKLEQFENDDPKYYEFYERAAILMDGGMQKKEAFVQAKRELLERRRLANE